LKRVCEKVKGVYEKVPGSGEWWIRYADLSHKIRREKAGTKASASRLYQKRKTETLQGKKLPETLNRRTVLFAELADDAMEYSERHKRSFPVDQGRIKALRKWFGTVPASAVTPSAIERQLTAAAKVAEWAPATVNRHKALLSLCYRIGMANRKVSENPARLVRPLKENNARIRYLSAEEEKALKAVVEADYSEHWPEIVLSLNTGMRAGEQYSLQWGNVDLVNRKITLTETKNGHSRHLPLNDAARGALSAMKARSIGAKQVVCNGQGKPIKAPHGWFQAAVRKAEIQGFTWHCLRHTFASRLVMAGVDIRTVAELMGHKTLQMTMRYAHIGQSHAASAVSRLAKWDVETNQAESATDTRTDTGQFQVSL
jgi:integrase